MEQKRTKLLSISCRYVPYDQWFLTHVDPTWKIKHLKQCILAKALGLPFDRRYLSSGVPSARPPSPITFAPDDSLRPVSPIEFAGLGKKGSGGTVTEEGVGNEDRAEVQGGEDGYEEDDEDEDAEGPSGARTPTIAKMGGRVPVPSPTILASSSKATGLSSATTAASVSTAATAGRSNIPPRSAAIQPGGGVVATKGIDYQEQIYAAPFTLVRFSTGQILEEDFVISWYDFAPHELVELHASSPPENYYISTALNQLLLNAGTLAVPASSAAGIAAAAQQKASGSRPGGSGHAHTPSSGALLDKALVPYSAAAVQASVASTLAGHTGPPLSATAGSSKAAQPMTALTLTIWKNPLLTSLPRSVPEAYVVPYWEGWARALRVVWRGDPSAYPGTEASNPNPPGSMKFGDGYNYGGFSGGMASAMAVWGPDGGLGIGDAKADDVMSLKGSMIGGSSLASSETPKKTRMEWRDRWVVIKDGIITLCKERDDPTPTHRLPLAALISLKGAEYLNNAFYQNASSRRPKSRATASSSHPTSSSRTRPGTSNGPASSGQNRHDKSASSRRSSSVSGAQRTPKVGDDDKTPTTTTDSQRTLTPAAASKGLTLALGSNSNHHSSSARRKDGSLGRSRTTGTIEESDYDGRGRGDLSSSSPHGYLPMTPTTPTTPTSPPPITGLRQTQTTAHSSRRELSPPPPSSNVAPLSPTSPHGPTKSALRPTNSTSPTTKAKPSSKSSPSTAPAAPSARGRPHPETSDLSRAQRDQLEHDRAAREREKEKERARREARENEIKEMEYLRRWDDLGLGWSRGKKKKDGKGGKDDDRGGKEDKDKQEGSAEKKKREKEREAEKERERREKEREKEKARTATQTDKERNHLLLLQTAALIQPPGWVSDRDRDRERDREREKAKERERAKRREREPLFNVDDRNFIPRSRDEADSYGMKIVCAKFRSIKPEDYEREVREAKEAKEAERAARLAKAGAAAKDKDKDDDTMPLPLATVKKYTSSGPTFAGDASFGADGDGDEGVVEKKEKEKEKHDKKEKEKKKAEREREKERAHKEREKEKEAHNRLHRPHRSEREDEPDGFGLRSLPGHSDIGHASGSNHNGYDTLQTTGLAPRKASLPGLGLSFNMLSSGAGPTSAAANSGGGKSRMGGLFSRDKEKEKDKDKDGKVNSEDRSLEKADKKREKEEKRAKEKERKAAEKERKRSNKDDSDDFGAGSGLSWKLGKRRKDKGKEREPDLSPIVGGTEEVNPTDEDDWTSDGHGGGGGGGGGGDGIDAAAVPTAPGPLRVQVQVLTKEDKPTLTVATGLGEVDDSINMSSPVFAHSSDDESEDSLGRDRRRGYRYGGYHEEKLKGLSKDEGPSAATPKASRKRKEEEKCEWVVLDLGSEAAYNSILRIFHRHFEAQVQTAFISTSPNELLGSDAEDDDFYAASTQHHHSSKLATAKDSQHPPVLSHFAAQRSQRRTRGNTLALPYPEWRNETLNRARTEGMRDTGRPMDYAMHAWGRDFDEMTAEFRRQKAKEEETRKRVRMSFAEGGSVRSMDMGSKRASQATVKPRLDRSQESDSDASDGVDNGDDTDIDLNAAPDPDAYPSTEPIVLDDSDEESEDEFARWWRDIPRQILKRDAQIAKEREEEEEEERRLLAKTEPTDVQPSRDALERPTGVWTTLDPFNEGDEDEEASTLVHSSTASTRSSTRQGTPYLAPLSTTNLSSSSFHSTRSPLGPTSPTESVVTVGGASSTVVPNAQPTTHLYPLQDLSSLSVPLVDMFNRPSPPRTPHEERARYAERRRKLEPSAGAFVDPTLLIYGGFTTTTDSSGYGEDYGWVGAPAVVNIGVVQSSSGSLQDLPSLPISSPESSRGQASTSLSHSASTSSMATSSASFTTSASASVSLSPSASTSASTTSYGSPLPPQFQAPSQLSHHRTISGSLHHSVSMPNTNLNRQISLNASSTYAAAGIGAGSLSAGPSSPHSGYNPVQGLGLDVNVNSAHNGPITPLSPMPPPSTATSSPISTSSLQARIRERTITAPSGPSGSAGISSRPSSALRPLTASSSSAFRSASTSACESAAQDVESAELDTNVEKPILTMAQIEKIESEIAAGEGAGFQSVGYGIGAISPGISAPSSIKPETPSSSSRSSSNPKFSSSSPKHSQAPTSPSPSPSRAVLTKARPVQQQQHGPRSGSESEDDKKCVVGMGSGGRPGLRKRLSDMGMGLGFGGFTAREARASGSTGGGSDFDKEELPAVTRSPTNLNGVPRPGGGVVSLVSPAAAASPRPHTAAGSSAPSSSSSSTSPSPSQTPPPATTTATESQSEIDPESPTASAKAILRRVRSGSSLHMPMGVHFELEEDLREGASRS